MDTLCTPILKPPPTIESVQSGVAVYKDSGAGYMITIVMEYNAKFTSEKFKNIAEAMDVDTTGMDQLTYHKAVIDAVRSSTRT